MHKTAEINWKHKRNRVRVDVLALERTRDSSSGAARHTRNAQKINFIYNGTCFGALNHIECILWRCNAHITNQRNGQSGVLLSSRTHTHTHRPWIHLCGMEHGPRLNLYLDDAYRKVDRVSPKHPSAINKSNFSEQMRKQWLLCVCVCEIAIEWAPETPIRAGQRCVWRFEAR